VVHLAAIPFDMDRQEAQILDTNIHGTSNALLASQEAGVQRVVNFSSINALGQAEKLHTGLYLPLDDEVPHFNVRNYSLSKHIGEVLCSAFAARGEGRIPERRARRAPACGLSTLRLDVRNPCDRAGYDACYDTARCPSCACSTK